MVKLFTNTHTYEHPWAHVTSAFWRKYPNPLAPHVKEVDCYDRHLDQQTGNLTTNRLIACDSTLPKWLTNLGIPNRLYGYETTVVNARSKKMTIQSRNMSGSSMLMVEEICTYEPSRANSSWTEYKQEARITSFLPLFASRLEIFSFNSISTRSPMGLQAMEILCQNVKTHGLQYLTSLTAVANSFNNFFSSPLT